MTAQVPAIFNPNNIYNKFKNIHFKNWNTSKYKVKTSIKEGLITTHQLLQLNQ